MTLHPGIGFRIDAGMQIGELAKRSGASVTTIRFYERKGLLPEPQRKDSGYRAYHPEALHRLQFIRQAKTLGFSLDEVREILRMRERSKCPCDDVIAIAQRHLHAVERRIRDLEKFRSELSRALKSWKDSKDKRFSADVFCVLIERTMANRMDEKGNATGAGKAG